MTAAQQRIVDWRRDPVLFVRQNFKVDPDDWQAEALRAWADPTIKRIAMKACAGPGKTAVLAWMGWQFLSCYGEIGEHPKGAALAITLESLENYLWPELARWRDRSPFLSGAFRQNSERIYALDHPETWFLSARSFPKSASAEEMGKTLSGLHSLYPFALIDESGAIPTAILRAADQMLARCKIGKVAQAGNPLSREGMLYAACGGPVSHQWHPITITGDPDDPKAWVNSVRVIKALGSQPQDWARTQIETYGRENPWVKVYILGQFPPSSLNSLLGDDDVEAAMSRDVGLSAYQHAQARLGVDVARFGDDRTVLFPRQGLRAFEPVIMRHARDSAASTDIATKVMELQAKYQTTATIMDATGGWAAGARDVLVASQDKEHWPVSVQFHVKGLNERYKNRRAEMWFHMAEWIKQGAQLPNIRELVSELTSPTYTFVGGQFMLEPKESIKERIGRSPDLADALALTFGVPETTAVKRKVPQYVPTYSGPKPSLGSGWQGS